MTTPPQPAIGVEEGRSQLHSAGVRRLGTGDAVLPEIYEAPARQRRWWLHPAFLLSVGLTLAALIGAAVWWIVTTVTDDSVSASNLRISSEAGNVLLEWDGPDAAYSLFEVSGDGSASDLSALVRGNSAWVFSAADLFDDSSCFVVRPASRTGEVTIDPQTVASQDGAVACLSAAG